MTHDHKIALVTGGAGFIGSHLVHGLLAGGYRVRVIDNLSGPGSWRRLSDVKDRVELVEADIRDEAAIAKAMHEVNVVFHKAALVSVPESVRYPQRYHEVNATATLGLLEAALRAKVQRVVYASTSAVYGESLHQPKVETMRALPVSPYGVSKFTGELYMTAFAKLHGLQTISLRYFNVFGAGQDPKSQYGAAVPNIVGKIVEDESPSIFGDGEQTRDFCSVQNIVHANLLAAGVAEATGEVINIGCGKRVSINQIVKITNQLLNKNVQAKYEPARLGDVRDSLADITAARELLNYEPLEYFEPALQRVVRYFTNSTSSATNPAPG